ncbi:MAG TPA: hypothetical protein VJQ77_05930 [Novosphingobium sp.]|nr:hypothetical protein [Novosphingobium sp.]
MTEQVLTIPRIAADEYHRRNATALRKVAAGEITRAQAGALMAPWASIALLSGVPVDELAPHLAAQLADLRKCIVHYAGDCSGPVYDHLLDEDEARILLATDICGPNTWGPTLSNARDTAIARADTEEKIDRARNLCRLARALDVPLTLASCGQPSKERIAA